MRSGGDGVGGKRLVVIAGSRERRGSIKEVPIDSETQQTPVKWMVRCKEIVAIVRADIEASDIYLVRHKTIMNTNTGYKNVKIKSCVINKAIPKI